MTRNSDVQTTDAMRRQPSIRRIAIVAPSLDILGGQGVQARSIAEALSADGVDVDLIPINPRFPKGFRWLRQIPILRTLFNQCIYIASLIRIRRADVVHIFSASYWSFLLAPLPALVAARVFAKPSILNYHSGEADDHLKNWGCWVHPWLRLADKIVVPSVYLRETFERYGYQAQVIRNVIDISAFIFRSRDVIRPKILSNRNLETHYGIDSVLKAFALVKRKYPEACLTIAGYGSQESNLRSWVENQNITGVDFVGRIEPEQMPDLYNDADIFINASTIDNQPISILEAFASGLPVVSTPTGDIPNMIGTGQRGVLVNDRNPETIAKAIQSLIENPQHALLLTRAAHEEACRYTWAKVRDCWLRTYYQTGNSLTDGLSDTEAGLDETTTHS